MNFQTKQTDLKVVLLGESGVGKSSLVLRLINNEFRPYYETTLGAAFTQKTLNYENTNYKFLIWDTAGQEKFHSLASIYYKDAQVALIIYDVNNHKTFDIMNKWIKELKEQASDNIQIVIIGNKLDIPKDKVDPFRQRASEIAEENKAIFMNTSALTGEGVQETFIQIAQRINQREKENRERSMSRERQTMNLINKKKNNNSSCQC